MHRETVISTGENNWDRWLKYRGNDTTLENDLMCKSVRAYDNWPKRSYKIDWFTKHPRNISAEKILELSDNPFDCWIRPTFVHAATSQLYCGHHITKRLSKFIFKHVKDIEYIEPVHTEAPHA